jgi:hypothetical protein
MKKVLSVRFWVLKKVLSFGFWVVSEKTATNKLKDKNQKKVLD